MQNRLKGRKDRQKEIAEMTTVGSRDLEIWNELGIEMNQEKVVERVKESTK